MGDFIHNGWFYSKLLTIKTLLTYVETLNNNNNDDDDDDDDNGTILKGREL